MNFNNIFSVNIKKLFHQIYSQNIKLLSRSVPVISIILHTVRFFSLNGYLENDISNKRK